MRNAGKIITVAAVAAALVACSPPNEKPSDLPPGAEPTHSAPQAQPGTPTQGEQGQGDPCKAEDVDVAQSNDGVGYEIDLPQKCSAPTELSTRELQAGSGPVASPGDQLDVDYTIVGWPGGEVKESSFGKLGTLSVQLGDSEPQFKGWNEALQGAQEGTRRVIVVPEDMGLAQDSNSELSGETLVAVAEVVELSPQQ